MKKAGKGCRLVICMGLSGPALSAANAQAPDDQGAAMAIRLVHPDRQASEVLKLFEGSRWPHPAAALTAWKQTTRDPGRLGKLLEALIALSNPEMVREWRILHDAELHLDLDPIDGSPRWYAVVPSDDGTIAAALIASRLTYPDDQPLRENGEEMPVARLGRSGVPVACQAGPMLIIASSRAELLRGMRRNQPDRPPGGPESARPINSGLAFRVTPGRVTTPRGGPLGLRRAVEALHAIGCRRLEGSVALQGGDLRLETTMIFEKTPPPRRGGREPAVVEPAWLEWIPSARVLAVVSLAIDPEPTSWDGFFGLADHVERVDPARAGLAPLRTRLNLLAAAAGVRPEADLWPHLRGVSACLLGEEGQAGRVTGALLMLHLDEESSAARLVQGFAPRFASDLPERTKGADAPDGGPGDRVPPPQRRRLGTVLGRGLSACRRGRSVIIAWGDGDSVAPSAPKPRNGSSLVAVCCGWGREGRAAPQRLGAFWPGRLWRWRPAGGLELPPATLRALADDPPAVWWGWNEATGARDCLRWPGWSRRVRSLLESLRLDPPRVP